MEAVRVLNLSLAYPLILMLRVYQKTVSPDHGPLRHLFPLGFCKFYPTCSAYALSSLSKYGIAGFPKIIKRLLACTPNSAGGVDLP